jgi:hypothetical protein
VELAGFVARQFQYMAQKPVMKPLTRKSTLMQKISNNNSKEKTEIAIWVCKSSIEPFSRFSLVNTST